MMIGRTVSHYRILEKLGEGGMGEVFLAEDMKLERPVALKFLPKHLTADKEARERFEREAKAAAALNHSNIVTIYEIGEHEGQVFIAMEYVEGQTLKELIVVNRSPSTPSSGTFRAVHPSPIASSPLPRAQVIEIATQIASGLAAAHARGIVHRDIKPQNILVDKDNHVKILDFGLAKLKGVSSLTKESSTLGTIYYMSPEQTMGKDVDQRSDIWSLGVLLYELLTEKLPFKGDYEQAVIYSILNEEPGSVTSIRNDAPAEFDRILDKALAKEPEDRYQHADDLLVDLKHLKRDSRPDRKPAKPAPAFVRRKSRHWMKWGIPAAVILLAAIAAILFFIPREKPGPAAKPAAIEARQGDWTNSIAVLPFRDFSSKKDQEYFCNGMTDAIIGRLARIPELKVIAATSVMRYKETAKDIKEIGRELQVENILEGTLQREGDQIRLSAQLISAENGFHLWADTYDRKLDKVFAIQDEISQAIAAALQIKLSETTRSAMKADPTRNLKAYEHSMRGQNLVTSYLLSRREADFTAAVDSFQRAIEADPGLVQAYDGLAWAYMNHSEISGNESEVALALKYCEAAYRLDPNLAEANTGLGWIRFAAGDIDGAYRFFRRALAFNPNIMPVNHIIGLFLSNLGLAEPAMHFIERAMQLDPAYFFSPYVKSRLLQMTGNFAGAEELLRKLIRLVPNDAQALSGYAQLLIKTGRAEEAYPLLERADKATPIEPLVQNLRALYWAARGDRERALQSMPEPKATVYAMLGMKEEALALMEREITAGKPYFYLDLLHSPLYDKLRAEPRFQAILRQQLAVHEERMRKYGNW
jgi:serine/threonine protein kinase/Tfp pilus assembly protein PilF